MEENSSSFRRSKGRVLHGNTKPIQRSIIDAFFKEAYFCGKMEVDFNEEYPAEIAQQKATMLHRKLTSWANVLRHNPRGREGMLTILVGCRISQPRNGKVSLVRKEYNLLQAQERSVVFQEFLKFHQSAVWNAEQALTESGMLSKSIIEGMRKRADAMGATATETVRNFENNRVE